MRRIRPAAKIELKGGKSVKKIGVPSEKAPKKSYAKVKKQQSKGKAS